MRKSVKFDKRLGRQQIMVMITLLILGYAATIALSTWQILRQISTDADGHSRVAISAALTQEIARADAYVHALTHWDDEVAEAAVRHGLNTPHRPVQLEKGLLQADRAWIINDKGAALLTFASEQATLSMDTPPAAESLKMASQDADRHSGFDLRNGQLSIVSTIALPRSSELAQLVKAEQSLFLVTQSAVSNTVLARAAADHDPVKISIGQPPSAQVTLPIFDGNGRAVGTLYWPKSAPSFAMVREVVPVMLGIATIFVLLVLFLLQRALGTYRHLNRQARTDWLSQLPNRSALNMAVRTAMREEKIVSLALIDLDSFKMVNDYHGHKTGDELVRIIARMLERLASGDAMAARLGGDEFALLLTGPNSLEHLISTCDQFHQALRAPIQIGEASLIISASIGIVEARDVTSEGELLRRADLAMYAAKRSGKACSIVHDPALDRRSAANIALKDDLVRAMERDEISLHYQPIYRANARDVVAFEALARWTHPKKGLVPASQFIPVAEEFGLISPMGNKLLERCCREWASVGDVRLTANISAAHISRPDFSETVSAILERTQFDPSRLVIEITETSLVKDGRRAKRALDSLTDLGVRIALDDFGSGYASIGFLQKFHFDMLKIDRSIVANCMESASARSMLQACIAMADVLNIETTAEGVETEAQAEMMCAFGCKYLQGFLFAEAMPLTAAADLIAPRGNRDMLLRA